MLKHIEASRSNWCIIEADDHRSDGAPNRGADSAPVQYCPLPEGTTPLHRALHRATAIAPQSQVVVTAFEEHRYLWEPLLWSVGPERRFICENRATARLASAAAILSVAAQSPSSVITILPACCSVMQEWMLGRALNNAIAELSAVPEGAITLGMADLEEGMDEDYLVVGRPLIGRGLRVDGFARRPIAWVVRHLRQAGALVASGL